MSFQNFIDCGNKFEYEAYTIKNEPENLHEDFLIVKAEDDNETYRIKNEPDNLNEDYLKVKVEDNHGYNSEPKVRDLHLIQ